MDKDIVKLTIRCRDDLPPVMLTAYGNAVDFMAGWVKLHQKSTANEGMAFNEIMTCFAENVTRVLMGETGGNG